MILDGAMGTMDQLYKLKEERYPGDLVERHPFFMKNNNDILSLTQPEITQDIHRQYLAPGADIIQTNTFNAASISQEDFGLVEFVPEMNRASARLAREAVAQAMASDPT